MKKMLLFLLSCVMLAGCSAAPTFETLGLVQHQQNVTPTAAEVLLSLPASAAAETFGGADTVYECDGYTLVLQTLASGDMPATVRALSGFSPEKLTIMESTAENVRRYDWVWTAAGEGGDMICRAAVLDDGNYHYCVYTLAPAHNAGKLTEEWNGVFASFRLA